MVRHVADRWSVAQNGKAPQHLETVRRGLRSAVGRLLLVNAAVSAAKQLKITLPVRLIMACALCSTLAHVNQVPDQRYGAPMDAAEFVAELGQEFPDMADELDDEVWRGLLHIQTGVFVRYTQAAIDRGDRAEALRCFLAADRAAAAGDPGVRNAIGVSFLEHLNFQDGKVRREWAFELLTERLKADAARLGVTPGHRRP